MRAFTFKDKQGHDKHVILHENGAGVYSTEIFHRKYTITREGKSWTVAPPLPNALGYRSNRFANLADAASACFEEAEAKAKILLPYGTVCRLSVECWEHGQRVERVIGIFADQQRAKAWANENKEMQVGWNGVNGCHYVLGDVRQFYVHHVINQPEIDVW